MTRRQPFSSVDGSTASHRVIAAMSGPMTDYVLRTPSSVR